MMMVLIVACEVAQIGVNWYIASMQADPAESDDREPRSYW